MCLYRSVGFIRIFVILKHELLCTNWCDEMRQQQYIAYFIKFITHWLLLLSTVQHTNQLRELVRTVNTLIKSALAQNIIDIFL